MVWQQWVLLIIFLIRIPFGVHREITRDLSEFPQAKQDRAMFIGIIACLLVNFTFMILVATI